jgi:putative transposase
MPQTFTNLVYHVIFSTKHRDPHVDAGLLQPLHAYLGGILLEIKARPIIVGGVADHVHVLAHLPKLMTVPDVLRVVKTNSSRRVHELYPARKAFAWQAGYAAFTVSHSGIERVRRYIANQAEHHQRESFQDE